MLALLVRVASRRQRPRAAPICSSRRCWAWTGWPPRWPPACRRLTTARPGCGRPSAWPLAKARPPAEYAERQSGGVGPAQRAVRGRPGKSATDRCQLLPACTEPRAMRASNGPAERSSRGLWNYDSVMTEWRTRVTAFTLTQQGGKWLMLQHQRLGIVRWELPGGHVETGESLEEKAVRETLEETGVAVRVGELMASACTSGSSGDNARSSASLRRFLSRKHPNLPSAPRNQRSSGSRGEIP